MIELLVGAGVAFCSGWIGYGVGRRNRRPATVEPICHCTHMIGMHRDLTGECMATVDGPKPERENTWGKVITWKQVPCACQHYSGPELISTFSIREVAQRPIATEQ